MRRNLIPEIGLTICVVAVQLVGVLALGWPAGNILLLLWFENLLLTLMTIPRMVVFRRLPEGGWGQVIGTAFGMLFFCAGHLVFSALLALMWRIEITWVALGVPAFLLVIRCVVEAVGRSRGEEPPEDFAQTYAFVWPRIIMLHVMILLCWTIALGGSAFSSVHMEGAIDQATIRGASVVVFLAFKAGVEIYTTLRPSRRSLVEILGTLR